MSYSPTPEQLKRYKENRARKLAAMTPEEREERLRKRREYEREKRIHSDKERREHDRAVKLAYVNRKTLENPNWNHERYLRSKLVKSRRAAELEKTLKEDEKICSRCKFVRKKDDFPMTRAGEPSTLCSKCYNLVTQRFDTESISYWKRKASEQNGKAKRRLKALNRLSPETLIPVTGDDLFGLWKSQDRKCAYCGIPLTVLITAYDHKVPLARGGNHCIDNIHLLCHNCNVSKFIMTDEDYRRLTQ